MPNPKKLKIRIVAYTFFIIIFQKKITGKNIDKSAKSKKTQNSHSCLYIFYNYFSSPFKRWNRQNIFGFSIYTVLSIQILVGHWFRLKRLEAMFFIGSLCAAKIPLTAIYYLQFLNEQFHLSVTYHYGPIH